MSNEWVREWIKFLISMVNPMQNRYQLVVPKIIKIQPSGNMVRMAENIKNTTV